MLTINFQKVFRITFILILLLKNQIIYRIIEK